VPAPSRSPKKYYEKPLYRVLIKEGQKVNAYYTAKISLFGAFLEVILTSSCEHLFIYTNDIKSI